jgi:hypothetical protein
MRPDGHYRPIESLKTQIELLQLVILSLARAFDECDWEETVKKILKVPPHDVLIVLLTGKECERIASQPVIR